MLTLPPGTVISFETEKQAQQAHAVLINESVQAGKEVALTAPLKLATPSYIHQRDQAEMALQQQLALLKAGGK